MRLRSALLASLALALFAALFALSLRAHALADDPRASAKPGNGLGVPLAPGRILNGIVGKRLLHFTFDDGPDARTTPQLLNELDAAGVKATFFFSASRFRDHSQRNAHARELALEVQRRGHNIGSHSVDHIRMKPMNTEKLRWQLDESDRLFTEIFGARTFLFRPPWGSHSPELDRLLAERNATTVLWNICSADWVIKSADKLETSFAHALPYLERTKGWRGGIVLMHDTHPWTVEAFPHIVAALRARNCELLASGEELYDIVDDLEIFAALEHDPESQNKQLAERQATLRAQTSARCAAQAN